MTFELLWPGKYDAQGRRQEPPTGGEAPREVERYGEASGWRNRLIHGDNLPVVASLLGELSGRVDLVYLDPPFATGDRFSLTAAVGDDTRAAAEIEAYDDREHDPSSFFGALAPRLTLARRLLTPTGLLFLHLDARASHGAKLLLDDLFGPRAFRGEVVWQPGNGAKGRRFFSLQHQVILAYARGDRWTFNGDDPSLREPFAPGSLRSHFRNVDEQGRKFRRRVVNGKEYIYYADEGRRVGSVWSDIPAMVAGSPVMDESTGYPTQKPLRLLERLLLACSNPGELVADLSCGSGTTLVAAERLGRRWLGCDVGALAIHTARKRLLAQGDERPLQAFAVHRHPSAARPAPGAAEGPACMEAPDSAAGPPSGGPEVAAEVSWQGGEATVVLHRFHTAGDNPPGGEASFDQLDAWSVGVLSGGVFEHRWQAQRTRRRRALPLRSPPLVLPAGGELAVRAYDVRGRAATAALGPVRTG